MARRGLALPAPSSLLPTSPTDGRWRSHYSLTYHTAAGGCLLLAVVFLLALTPPRDGPTHRRTALYFSGAQGPTGVRPPATATAFPSSLARGHRLEERPAPQRGPPGVHDPRPLRSTSVGLLRFVPPDLSSLPALLEDHPFLVRLLETFAAVGQVAVLAGAGFLLRRLRVLDHESTKQKALSKVTLTLLLPCFLLSRLAPLQLDDLLRARGLDLGLFLLIASGFALGEVTARVLNIPKRYSRTFSSGCAFGNGTSLPIIMVSSIVTSCASLREVYSETEAIGVLAVALPVQHILMWLASYNYVKGTLFPHPAQLQGPLAPLEEEDSHPASSSALDVSDGPLRSLVQRALQDDAAPAPLQPARFSFWRYDSAGGAGVDVLGAAEAVRQLLNPPLLGIACGFLLAAVGPLQGAWCEPEGALFWLASPLERLGEAVVPISMMTLGSNLSEGPGEKMDFKPITALFVVRQLLMPLAGVGLSLALRHAGVFPDGDALPPLVLMVLASAPTANNIVTIATACSAGAVEISTCVFWQYVGFLFLQLLYIPLFVTVAECL